jgi:hypothetical protein
VSRLGVPVGGFLTYLVRTETAAPTPVSARQDAARRTHCQGGRRSCSAEGARGLTARHATATLPARPAVCPPPLAACYPNPCLGHPAQACTHHPRPLLPRPPRPSPLGPRPQGSQRVVVEVRRRFSDFEALHRQLKAHFGGFFFPPLPQKAWFESRLWGTESSADKVRRVDLQVRGRGGPAPGGRAGAATGRQPRRRRRRRQQQALGQFLSLLVQPQRRLPRRAAGNSRRPTGPSDPALRPARRQAYMRSIGGHPVLRASEELRLFLSHPGDLSGCARWQQLVARPKSKTVDTIMSGLGLGTAHDNGGGGAGDGSSSYTGVGGGAGGGGAAASGGLGFKMLRMKQSLMGVVASKPKRQVVFSPEEVQLRAAKEMFRCALGLEAPQQPPRAPASANTPQFLIRQPWRSRWLFIVPWDEGEGPWFAVIPHPSAAALRPRPLNARAPACPPARLPARPPARPTSGSCWRT